MSGPRRLLHYVARYRRGWLAMAVGSLLLTCASLLEPWPMQIVVDNVLGGRTLSGPVARAGTLLPGMDTREGLLFWAVLAGLLIFGLHSVLNVALTLGSILVGQRMTLDVAHDLFECIQRRSLLFHARHPVGDSIARVGVDSWCVYTVAQHLLIAPLQAIITAGVMVAVMARVDVRLAALSVAVAPLIAVSSLVVGRPLHALSRVRQDIEGRLKSHVHQTLSGLIVVRGFSQEDREHRRFQEIAGEAIRANRRQAGAMAFLTLAGNGVATLGMAAILWLAGRHVLDGELGVGEMLVFVAYLTLLQEQFKMLAQAYGALQSARGSIDRVIEVLDAEPEVSDRPGARILTSVHGAIQLQRVSFAYEPDHLVLHDVSLDVAPGQTLALVGPTGAGKSTLVSLVPRFFDPSSGRVLVDGHDLRDLSLRSLRAQLAIVLQEPFLFPLSIADNIAYGRPTASRADIETAARAANAHAFIQRLPHGYDTLVGERGATLSGGERQRLSIARALIKDAPILILDEPTSALDAETEAALLEALHRLMSGRTTLIIAHRLSTIRNADRIVVLDNGAITETGTHAELLARNGRYAHFYRLQHAGPRARLAEPALA